MTIAQHKNRIPFVSDSLITASRTWYEKQKGDNYGKARAFLYNGIVLNRLHKDEDSAFQCLKQSVFFLEENQIKDDKLLALAYANLGKLNNRTEYNLKDAANYFQKAIEIESRLGNPRNEIINYCDLLVCMVENGDAGNAANTKRLLDSTMLSNPTITLSRTDNAKAIYFLYSEMDLDSALYYCKKWNANPADMGAKENMIAHIYAEQGYLDSAVAYEKKSLAHCRQEDTLFYHVYYRHLADYYGRMGCPDSSAHYAKMAYSALHDRKDVNAVKRILELEKQYDLSEKEAELERVRHQRTLMVVLLATLLLLVCGLVFLLRNREQKLRAERITRSFVQAAARTHQFTLSSLKPFASRRKSATADELKKGIADLATALRKGFSDNFAAAIESSSDALTPRQRAAMQKLSGERAKTVYILTELGYGEEVIAEYTCTSIDSVRVTINNNKRVLASREGAET